MEILDATIGLCVDALFYDEDSVEDYTKAMQSPHSKFAVRFYVKIGNRDRFVTHCPSNNLFIYEEIEDYLSKEDENILRKCTEAIFLSTISCDKGE